MAWEVGRVSEVRYDIEPLSVLLGYAHLFNFQMFGVQVQSESGSVDRCRI